MDDLATWQAFDAAEQQLQALTGVRPTMLATDLHPGYRSVALGRRARRRPAATSGAAPPRAHRLLPGRERDCVDDPAGPVIGIAFDGTGYGDDGAVWGGEVLLADYRGFTRAGAPGLRGAARR